MSFEFTKENMNDFFMALGKEFRRLNGTKMRAEIVLIGGGAVLANYGFRDFTNDMDAIIRSSSVMKEAILFVSDKFDLPYDWLNTDFKRTESYSNRLEEVSVYYRTYSNILEIRTVTAEYLIAMKLMSGRRYKNDLSDIAGILWEHNKNDKSITREIIENAFIKLYNQKEMPEISKKLLDDVFDSKDFESAYVKFRESEINLSTRLIEFDKNYPGERRNVPISEIIERIEQMEKERSNI